jgi:O-acetyl-ADP-ribose deacetylase (regulator of RNase III)
MSVNDRWTNASVVALEADDPVSAIVERARNLVAKALDLGWSGPPFDPIALARLLGIEVVANGGVRDARLLTTEAGAPLIEYNPTRPRGRVRYSIAHEVAHTLFSDYREHVRHRGGDGQLAADDWQLEALCNIAAAELLMPLDSAEMLADTGVSVEIVLAAQKKFDVSLEALLIRAVRLQHGPLAMFSASRLSEGRQPDHYRLDYLIGSPAWSGSVRRGILLPAATVVSRCIAIGYTDHGRESWVTEAPPVDVDCVGIPPYPGDRFPRVVGFIREVDLDASGEEAEDIHYVRGDATKPGASEPLIIAHIVNDSALTWGGGGFAAAVRRTYPAAQEDYRAWAMSSPGNHKLGQTHIAAVGEHRWIASMIAQHGHGPSAQPRIRYEALRQGLQMIAGRARELGATVHMPRIGTGMAGGSWELIKSLIRDTLIESHVSVTVYTPPDTSFSPPTGTALK